MAISDLKFTETHVLQMALIDFEVEITTLPKDLQIEGDTPVFRLKTRYQVVSEAIEILKNELRNRGLKYD